ncbi:DUF86 domain-containing protein [Rhodoblastus acidophilus]|uniref:DUF86 domain-containing protein n=1 Tax=Candidatus Rhodoblastus alkanivorans TaxID=2954117 RepID=A0ABS9ZB47_9HYPH|nr:HepT-like ribonuclease domain-containing protein [Candidatus Rhodoblastus alkanivorans]MCI4677962.1 DUF86 domain-containing protein [Candidatus Rhodoblastus alkanivorans]MCI4683857.1 DUF86 domain-containing protein [Candidatus Rhodoblastus alkanivorans]MDI4641175.1 DUF86 domain-containing protein [Rhodoblastus acidophilus]
MRRDDAIRIRHMIEAAEAVQRFLAGRRRGDLDADEILRFALVRAVEIIGEAAAKLGVETRAALPSIPWAAMVAMRNRLIHAYFDIDHDILWKTVADEIPALLSSLRSISLDE